MEKISNRKTTRGRLISYQTVTRLVPVTQKTALPLELNWFMKLLIWLRISKAEDYVKYISEIIGFKKVVNNIIKHRQTSTNQNKIDKIMSERAKKVHKNSKPQDYDSLN